MSHDFTPYQDQLKDERWFEFRQRVFHLDGYKCVLCGSTDDLQAHHDHYNKGKMAWEYKLHEVVTLCDRCHELHHKMQAVAKELLIASIDVARLDWVQILRLASIACSLPDDVSEYKTTYHKRALAIYAPKTGGAQ